MNREWKRRMKRDQDSKDRLAAQMRAAGPGGPKRERTSFKQFVKEVQAELKRVNWPTKQEVVTYSVVVLFVVLLMVGLVFAFDFAFAKAVFALFKPPTAPAAGG